MFACWPLGSSSVVVVAICWKLRSYSPWVAVWWYRSRSLDEVCDLVCTRSIVILMMLPSCSLDSRKQFCVVFVFLIHMYNYYFVCVVRLFTIIFILFSFWLLLFSLFLLFFSMWSVNIKPLIIVIICYENHVLTWAFSASLRARRPGTFSHLVNLFIATEKFIPKI